MTNNIDSTNKARFARNAVALGGFALLIGGVGAYDLRVGCVVAGAMMFAGGVLGMLIASRGTGRKNG